MCKHIRFLFIVIFFIPGAGWAQDWKSPYYIDHPLVGKIWDTGKNQWLSVERLKKEIIQYDYILLGEVHNNADHHQLQANLLKTIAQSKKQPVVVMEMLEKQTWEGQPQTWNDVDKLKQQSSAINERWPWDLYAPILEVIVEHNLELMAGNIDSKALHEWSNKIGPLNPEEVLTNYWISKINFAKLKSNIVDSHCGYANKNFVQFMARAQLQRDFVITSTLVENKKPVVLIAGSGHVRNDYAIPMQLVNKFKQYSYISIAFISVQPDLNEPQDYMDESGSTFDVLYFTPSHTNQDPCVQFSKQLQKMRQK